MNRDSCWVIEASYESITGIVDQYSRHASLVAMRRRTAIQCDWMWRGITPVPVYGCGRTSAWSVTPQKSTSAASMRANTSSYEPIGP